jgi:hypothetical protein
MQKGNERKNVGLLGFLGVFVMVMGNELLSADCWPGAGTVHTLEEILGAIPAGAARVEATKEINYLCEHQNRMDYRAGSRCGEPIGSGAIESTCRQAQCRFKRPGQYWSQQGDEALLGLETFWRNNRWHLLFPHNRNLGPSEN